MLLPNPLEGILALRRYMGIREAPYPRPYLEISLDSCSRSS